MNLGIPLSQQNRPASIYASNPEDEQNNTAFGFNLKPNQLSTAKGVGTPDSLASIKSQIGDLSVPNTGLAGAKDGSKLNFLEKNSGTIGNIVSGIGLVTSFLAARDANKTAKEGLQFQKEAFNKQLRNSVQAYNTQLSDRAASRASFEGKPVGSNQAYVEKNKLSA